MKIKKFTTKLDEFQNLVTQLNRPLTLAEAAKYLRLSKSYLYLLTSKHQIPHYKPTGKMIFFMKSELDDWVYSKQIISSKTKTNGDN